MRVRSSLRLELDLDAEGRVRAHREEVADGFDVAGYTVQVTLA